ncbi:MAG: TIGR00730 family Rossman fold protein, partial [Chromatiales bacterium]|nr:TIGR00730 family Rossman fold protein [Chromatiales bacterium]
MNNLPTRERTDNPRVKPALSQDSWKVFQIMSEFVDGFEQLAPVWPSVSIFGSARTPRDNPNYQKAEEISR